MKPVILLVQADKSKATQTIVGRGKAFEITGDIVLVVHIQPRQLPEDCAVLLASRALQADIRINAAFDPDSIVKRGSNAGRNERVLCH